MQKRGQAFLFVLLGIIILFLIILGLYYRDAISQNLSKVQILQTVTLPEQAKKVSDYVESCISTVAANGVNILGIQGGYINIPEDNIPLTGSNPFSNKLAIVNNLRIPYWNYEAANGVQKTQVPSLENMQDELSNYINNNLLECVDEFSNLGQEYSIKYKNPVTKTSIKENKVLVDITFPVDIDVKGNKFSLKSFASSVDSNLGQSYNIAKEILDKENSDYFLEEKTIDTLVLGDSIPFSSTDFDCNVKVWSKSKIVDNIKQALSENIPFIKVKGTSYSLKDSSRKYFEWDALRGSYRSLNVELLYSENWPTFIDVFPSEGDIMQSDQFSKSTGTGPAAFFGSLLCINQYNFIYDIKYPVLITIDDNGYLFQFPIQVIIKHNQPKENKLGTLEPFNTNKEICEARGNPVTIYTLTPEQDNSLNSVFNASVSFKCLNTVCDAGRTNEQGQLTARLPACINAIVYADKQGFNRGQNFISTNEESSATIIMDRVYDKNVDVKIIDKGLIRTPNPTEQIFFLLENKDKNFVNNFVYPSEINKIKLIPGSYKISSYVIDNSNFNIDVPSKEVEKCVQVPQRNILGLLGATKEECVKVQTGKQVLNSIVKGGGSVEFELNKKDLEKAEKIILYTRVSNLPADYSAISNIYENLENITINKPELK